jgi:hypothetical protein
MILFSISPGIIVSIYTLAICDECGNNLIKSENFVVVAATFCLTSLAAITTLLAILMALKGTQILKAYRRASYLGYFMLVYGIAIACLILNLVFCGMYLLNGMPARLDLVMVPLYFTNIFQVLLVIFMISALAYQSMNDARKNN